MQCCPCKSRADYSENETNSHGQYSAQRSGKSRIKPKKYVGTFRGSKKEDFLFENIYVKKLISHSIGAAITWHPVFHEFDGIFKKFQLF